MMNPSERTKRMAERLQLSEEQVKKITEIFEASMKEMQEMRKSSEGDRESARAKMAERRKVEIEKIKALLTEEQAKKFDEMMARGPRGRGPGGPGGPEGKRHD
jgi:Spy/CpxP family protein refolding chaperone